MTAPPQAPPQDIARPSTDPTLAAQEAPPVTGPPPSLQTPSPSPIAPLDDGRVAKRISGLSQLEPWLPSDALVALARTPTLSDQSLMSVASSLRNAYKTVDSSIHWFHNDPVLAKEPSALLSLHRYLTSSIGPWPIEDAHLVSIQAGLQRAGFARGLPTDGVWSNGWNAAWDQWASKQSADVLAGKQVGGTTTGGALNHLLGAFLPTSAANAIAGFATGLVHTGRTAVADAGGAVVGLSTALGTAAYHLATHGNLGGTQTAAHVQSAFENAVAGRGYTTPQGLEDRSYRTALGQGLSAGSTFAGAAGIAKGLFAVHAALGAGSEVAAANGLRALPAAAKLFPLTGTARTEAIGDLGLQAAVRGPGAIANSVGQVADLGNVFRNVPLLGRVGPWVATLDDADGLYYRARTLLATPSVYMPVRVAGTAMGQTMLAGAKLRGAAAAVNLAGGAPTPFSSSVEGFHGADAVNDAVKNRLAFTAFGHHVEIGLNALPFLLRIPAGLGLAPSDTIGSDATGATNAVMHAIGPSTSLAAQYERGAGVPLAKLVNGLGGELRFGRLATSQIYQHAAAHYAEVEMSRLAADERPVSEQAALDMMHAFEAEAYKGLADGNPVVMNRAIAEMLANDQGRVSYQMGGPNELSKRIARSVGYTTRGPKADLVRDGNAFLDASDHLENGVLPNADFLVHPGTFDPVDPAPGRIGLMKLENTDADQGAEATAAFRRRYEAAQAVITRAAADQRLTNVSPLSGEDMDRVAQARGDLSTLEKDVSDFMFRELGIEAKKIPGDLNDRIQGADDYVRANLAGPVRVGGDAPATLTNALAAIHDLGYKPVYGKDIGWMHAAPTPLDVLSAPVTRRRKLLEGIGLSPENVPTADLSFWKYKGQRDEVQKLVDSGKVRLPPYYTVDSLLHELWNQDAIDLSPDAVTRGVYATVGRASRAGRIDELLPQMAGRTASEGDARKLVVGDLENELTRAMGLENIGRAKVVKALTRPFNPAFPETFPAATNEALQRSGFPSPTLMTTEDANKVYRAIVKGSAAPPAYVLGASKLDQLARTVGSRLGFLGKVGPNVPRMAGTVGDMVANLPNELLTLRTRLRFQLSPEFAFRRIAKANVKLWLDGVPGTIAPLDAMKTAGTYDSDIATLDRVMPELHNPQYDQAAEALYSNDAFGFYSHRNWEAYAAGHWERMGKADPEIRRLLIKDFGYGSGAFGEGRSAAERTVNQIFFPFSFDKTLYRNVGGYLLDHPARMMMLTGALNAYNAFSTAHPDTWGSGPWLDKHVPVLKEAQRLNAFAHSVSLGQFGGINAPLLNAFLPQKWDSTKHTISTIGSFVPAVSEINNAYQEFRAQGGIAATAAGDQIRRSTGHEDFTHPWVAAETPQAQISDAYVLRRTMMTDLKPYLDANAKRRAGNKIVLDDPKFGRYDGQPVNSSLVDRIVRDRYPAFDPAAPAVFSDQQKAALQNYLDNMSGPHAGYIRQWAAVATKLGTDIYNGRYDSADAASNTQIVRNAAVWLAERDAAFLKAYDSYFRYQFGPLTEVKG